MNIFHQNKKEHIYQFSFSALLLFLSLLFSACVAIFPMEGAYKTPSGIIIQGWQSNTFAYLFPFIFLLTLLFSTLSWFFINRQLFGVAPGFDSFKSILQALKPCVWLPIIVISRHNSAWFGTAISGLALPLGVPLVLAFTIERFTRTFFESKIKTHKTSPIVHSLLLLIISFLSLIAIHMLQNRQGRFSGGGDVCHYEIQIQNFLDSGSFDLTDRVKNIMEKEKISKDKELDFIHYSHMRKNSEGRIFSVHAFGWPLLAVPFAYCGSEKGILLLCIMLSSFCLVGMYLTCLRCGASSIASYCACLTLFFSLFWVYTSLSKLPEMLGCMLCIWAFWATLAIQDSKRVPQAFLITAIACSYLPFAHMRFIPIAIILLLGFTISTTIKCINTKRIHYFLLLLALYSIITISWHLLFKIHGEMFVGSKSFSFSSIFFTHPTGILGIFADRRGVGPVYPLIWIAALIPFAFFSSNQKFEVRFAAIFAMLLQITTLISCCTNIGTLVGACISGRYYLQAIPPLIPFLALYLDNTGRAGRTWWIYLSSLPVLYLLIISPFCSDKGIIFAPYGIWDIDAFKTFWQPFRMMYTPLPNIWQASICLILPLILMILPWLLFKKVTSKKILILFCVLLSVGVTAGLYANTFLPKPKASTPESWALANFHGWKEFRRLTKTGPIDYLTTFAAQNDTHKCIAIYTDNRNYYNKQQKKPIIFIGNNVKTNDWNERNLTWHRFRSYRTPKHFYGLSAVKITGKVKRGKPLIAFKSSTGKILSNGIPLPTGHFTLIFLLPKFHKIETLFFEIAFEDNKGETLIQDFDVMPWMYGLDKAAGSFPKESIVIDCTTK